MTTTAAEALSSYRQVGNTSHLESANPVELIQALFHGALDSLALARGHLERGEVALKGEQIGRAISIVEGLRGALNDDAGSISTNLDRLYEYIGNRLLVANLENDGDALAEASRLLGELKGAWDAAVVR